MPLGYIFLLDLIPIVRLASNQVQNLYANSVRCAYRILRDDAKEANIRTSFVLAVHPFTTRIGDYIDRI